MTYYIITVKRDKNPLHDPRNKKTGMCELSPECTDSTGEHHSFLGTYKDVDALKAEGVHITRTERVAYDNIQRVLRDGLSEDLLQAGANEE